MATSRSTTASLTKSLGQTIHSVSGGDSILGHLFKFAFAPKGFNDLLEVGFREAKEHKGISQAFLGPQLMVFVTDPDFIKTINQKRECLLDHETGGLQEEIFGKETLVSLGLGEAHRVARAHLLNVLYTPVRTYTDEMQQVITNVFHKIKEDPYSPVNYERLGNQMALLMIAKSGLGIHLFPEKLLEKFLGKMDAIMQQLPNLSIISRLIIQNKIKKKGCTSIPSFIPSITKIIQEGEEIIHALFRINAETVLPKMKALTGNPNLTKDDLHHPNCINVAKLVLVGGADTTSKTLRDTALHLQLPENQKYVQAIFRQIQAYGKTPREWKKEDVVNILSDRNNSPIKALVQFNLEMLRWCPPFQSLRNTVIKDLKLTENITIPAGAIIVSSVKEAHRAAHSGFGDNADQFDPDRWDSRNLDLGDINSVGEMNDHSIDKMKQKSGKIGPFLTFGNDTRRVCLGRRAANQEGLLFTARFIYEFEFKPCPNTSFRYESGLTLKLTPDSNPIGYVTPLPEAKWTITSHENDISNDDRHTKGLKSH